MELSVPTLIFATGLVGISVVGVMLILYPHHRSAAGYGTWVAGLALQTAGLLLLSLQGTFPDAMRVALGSSVAALAPVAYMLAMARLLDLKAPVRVAATLTAAAIAVVWAVTYLAPDAHPTVRPLVLGVQYLVVTLLQLSVMVRGLASEPGPAFRTLVGIVAGIALTMLGRTLYVALTPDTGGTDSPTSIALMVGNLIFFTTAGIAFVGVLEDRNRRAYTDANRDLARQSRTDDLTGLANRREFDDVLATEVARAVRYGRPLALVLLDLDHFKAVNDTLGHATGDRVLRRVAQVMRSTSRANDLAARTGGEELAMLLPETTADDAVTIAERLRERIRAAALPSGRGEAPLTTSAGVASLAIDEGEASGAPDDDVDTTGAAAPSQLERTYAVTLVERADDALYTAKRSGRDRTVVARPLLAADVTSVRHPTIVRHTLVDDVAAND